MWWYRLAIGWEWVYTDARMMKKIFLCMGIGVAAAVEAPPTIPEGNITYDEMSYQGGSSELPADFVGGNSSGGGYDAMETVTPPSSQTSSSSRTEINLVMYASDYQVRGMGVTNDLSQYGTSSLYLSHILANRNMFNKGIQQRVHGLAGVIWDASCPLGDIMQFRLGYAIGKEVLPNFTVELGYNFRRGGLEGYMAKWHDDSSHRGEQDLVLAAVYNDYQKGFFGHAEVGAGFYGLTGFFMDFEVGYRFADVIKSSRMGGDVELSFGAAPSFSYWGTGVEGLDACRLKIALVPYSHAGTFGRDAHTKIKPWVQFAWTGNNARKITRNIGYTPVDHFQFTLGLDVGWRF